MTVIGNLTKLWMKLELEMNETHLAALAPNQEKGVIGWYNKQGKFPHYKTQGIHLNEHRIYYSFKNLKFPPKSNQNL